MAFLSCRSLVVGSRFSCDPGCWGAVCCVAACVAACAGGAVGREARPRGAVGVWGAQRLGRTSAAGSELHRQVAARRASVVHAGVVLAPRHRHRHSSGTPEVPPPLPGTGEGVTACGRAHAARVTGSRTGWQSGSRNRWPAGTSTAVRHTWSAWVCSAGSGRSATPFGRRNRFDARVVDDARTVDDAGTVDDARTVAEARTRTVAGADRRSHRELCASRGSGCDRGRAITAVCPVVTEAAHGQ